MAGHGNWNTPLPPPPTMHNAIYGRLLSPVTEIFRCFEYRRRETFFSIGINASEFERTRFPFAISMANYQRSPTLSLRTRSFMILGIYNSNMARFDKYFISFLYYYSNYYEGTIWYAWMLFRAMCLYIYICLITKFKICFTC